MATPIFCCGFECGVGHWGPVGSVTYNTTANRVRNGSRSLRMNPSASLAFAGTTAISAGGFPVMRCYVFFDTLPNITCRICSAGSAGVGAIFNASDNKIYAGINTTTLGATGVSVTTGQWYKIDLKVTSTTVDVQVDGSAAGQATTGSIGSVTSVSFGDTGLSPTADWYIDDVLVSFTAADYPLDGGYVNHFVPTSDGTHNVAGTGDFQRTLTGTDILNSTTTAFQLVDDIPLDSGAGTDWINMLAPPNATDYVECVFGPAPGISTPTVAPTTVEVLAGIRQSATGNGNMEIRINDNGTTNAMYSATGVAGVTSVTFKRKHYVTAPTGGAWVVTSGNGNFNNLKVQFGSPAALDVNPDQYFTSIMLEANFVPPAGGSTVPVLLPLLGVG